MANMFCKHLCYLLEYAFLWFYAYLAAIYKAYYVQVTASRNTITKMCSIRNHYDLNCTYIELVYWLINYCKSNNIGILQK